MRIGNPLTDVDKKIVRLFPVVVRKKEDISNRFPSLSCPCYALTSWSKALMSPFPYSLSPTLILPNLRPSPLLPQTNIIVSHPPLIPLHYLPALSLPSLTATLPIARYVPTSCGSISRDKIPRMRPTGRSALFEWKKREVFACHICMLTSVKYSTYLSLQV